MTPAGRTAMSSCCRISRVRRRRRGARVSSLLLLLALAAAAGPPAGAQGFEEDPNWPCIQRKVPEISPGMVWAGPPLEGLGHSWRDDPAVAELAAEIASRRTSVEDAGRLIQRFADDAEDDKPRKLTLLFAGALETINGDRASIIAGIERYAKRQRALAAKIERQSAELAALPVKGTAEQVSEREDLQEIQNWDIRIFEEREHALAFICEQPVALERRAFALGREIMKHLD